MTTLTDVQIINAVESVKGGQMARVCYKSELPVKAKFKKMGIRVFKITEATVRFGVDYEHISSVIESKANESPDEPKRHYTNNYEWIIENRVSYNSNTGKKYIRFAPLNNGGANKKSMYIVVDSADERTEVLDSFGNAVEKLNDEQKSMIIDSYWNGNHGKPDVQNIGFDNILRINNVGDAKF